MRRIISICKEVPLLPIAIIAAIPLALLGSWRPWEAAGVSLTFGPFNPGVGQWIVIALVVYTIVVTVIGMIDDLRHGHVGVDLLAVIAIASTVAVQEYWAAWAVVLMISSGEAIEEFAQSKAEGNLTALVDAAPRTAHVVTLPGVGARAAAAGADGTAGDAEGDMTADGFRKVASVDVPNAAETNKSTTQTKPYDAAGEHFETVPVDQVKLGDVILVLPGETVPVDGELLSGVATLDPEQYQRRAGAARSVCGRARAVGCGQRIDRADDACHAIGAGFAVSEDPRTGVVGAGIAPDRRQNRRCAGGAVHHSFAGDRRHRVGRRRHAIAIRAGAGFGHALPAADRRSRRVRGRHRSPCQGGHSYQSAGRAGKLWAAYRISSSTKPARLPSSSRRSCASRSRSKTARRTTRTTF